MPYAALHRSSRNPFEYGTVAGMAILGGAQVIFDRYPGMIYTFTSDFFRIAWAIMLFGGAITTLLGLIHKRHARGLSLEVVGLYFMGGACLIYSFTLWASGLSASWAAATSFTILGVCSLIRSNQVHRGLRKIGRGEVKVVKLSDGSTALIDVDKAKDE